VVHRFAIPRELLDALLDGFLWDARAALRDARGPAGLRRARGRHRRRDDGAGDGHAQPRALARACELGVAMQLTNIARDVGEDARNGRLYLPRQWLREAGIDPEAWLPRPRSTPPSRASCSACWPPADELYERAEHGIAALPRDCRPAIQAARLVYAEIGREIERQGLDSVAAAGLPVHPPDYAALEAQVHGRARDPARRTRLHFGPFRRMVRAALTRPARARNGPASPRASPSGCWRPARSTPC
jgi:hypothetical protein